MRTLTDETQLDAPPSGTWHYIRSKLAPHVLQHPKFGEAYTRQDGAEREWPGYAVGRDNAGRITREPKVTYCDDARYPAPALTEAR